MDRSHYDPYQWQQMQQQQQYQQDQRQPNYIHPQSNYPADIFTASNTSFTNGEVNAVVNESNDNNLTTSYHQRGGNPGHPTGASSPGGYLHRVNDMISANQFNQVYPSLPPLTQHFNDMNFSSTTSQRTNMTSYYNPHDNNTAAMSLRDVDDQNNVVGFLFAPSSATSTPSSLSHIDPDVSGKHNMKTAQQQQQHMQQFHYHQHQQQQQQIYAQHQGYSHVDTTTQYIQQQQQQQQVEIQPTVQNRNQNEQNQKQRHHDIHS